MKKVLHADMQLSTRSNDCWSAHIISAMDGLTQSCIFKQKLQNCKPIDLSRFVVDLRERYLEYWTPHSETHPREHNSKRFTYHQCSSYLKGSGHSFALYLISFPNTSFSICLVMSFAVQLVSDFVSTPYVLRQQHGIKVISPPVTCVKLMISAPTQPQEELRPTALAITKAL
jgi:hypothetical protein